MIIQNHKRGGEMEDVSVAHPILDTEKSNQEPEPIEIKDFFMADNYLMKMIRLQTEINQIEELYKKELEQLESWRKDRLNKLDEKFNFYKGSLEAWLSNNNEKKADLPHGKVCFRKQKHKVKILDEDAIIENEEFVRIKKKPDKRAILRAFKNQGLIPDGTDIIRPDPKFYVKLKTSKGGAK